MQQQGQKIRKGRGIRLPDLLIFLFTFSAFAACGARTGLLTPTEAGAPADAGADVADVTVDVPEEPDAAVEADAAQEPEEDVAPFPDGPNNCPDAGSTLVYLITQQNVLMSFYPPTTAFTSIGTINCPDPGGGTPFSMAVSRSGVAYVVFTSGNLFRVSTLTAACVATPFVSGATAFPPQFGMGFSADGRDAGTDGGETLYVAGDPGWSTMMPGPASLASIDTTSYALHVVGPFLPTILEPELTGTGAGNLYGFWAPDTTSDTSIVQIDKPSAQVTPVVTLPGVTFGGGWAFSFWGGDFYVFTAPGGMGSSSIVTRYRPSDGSITQVATAPGVTIVGAGVSTCAPQM
jgi:hypothetical protein